MDYQLANKVCIVTGASRGIGRAIAQTLSEEGARVVLVARSADLLNTLAQSLPSESLVVPADLRQPNAPSQVAQAALERFGQLDGVVNNAGATKRGDFFALTDDDWADGFALKFFGAMRLCRAAWPHLVASRGSIVNISGVGGRVANADFTIGGSVNAAVLNFSKALADRGVSDGVRVNAINPGSIATDRLKARAKTYAAERNLDEATALSQMAQNLRVSRFGEPVEMARAVAFLLSPTNAYCQGLIMDVDGGQVRAL